MQNINMSLAYFKNKLFETPYVKPEGTFLITCKYCPAFSKYLGFSSRARSDVFLQRLLLSHVLKEFSPWGRLISICTPPTTVPQTNQGSVLPKFTLGTNEFTRLSYRAWMRGCCQGCCGPKAATLEYLHSATGGDSPVATDGVPLLIVSLAYLLYPHPRPQRPPAAKANGWESGWILRWETSDSQCPASLRECQQWTAQLWGAHTARLMTVTLLCWGLGRIALHSSTLSVSLMRASWAENRTQGEKQGWEIFLSQLQRAGWEEFHENEGNRFGNHLSKIGEVSNKVWVQFPTRAGATKVPE